MSQAGFTAPHYLASQTGMQVLQDGGSAIDAMVAAAACIAVVYPHMNSLGGDGFWLIQRQGEAPVAIDACGPAAQLVNPDGYTSDTLPARGTAACITQGGTVSGWQRAREYLSQWRQPLPLSELFEDAITYCETGFSVSESFVNASHKILSQGGVNDAFKQTYTRGGEPLSNGDTLVNPELANSFRHLAQADLNAFYQGDIGQRIYQYFETCDSPLAAADFMNFSAQYVEPLSVVTSRATLYNLPAPTQGIASLLILAIYDRLYQASWNEALQIHYLVEATKLAFQIRNRYVVDPADLTQDLNHFLDADYVHQLSDQISSSSVLPWPHTALPGDTVWMGAVDHEGTLVSFIQSIYWEFGSGVVIPDTGVLWNNRGVSFSLDKNDSNYLRPGRKPRHTLNPAMAVFNDGKRMAYGTMGGEGQPQTQAAFFNRYVYQQQSLADTIAAPRWLLGRAWGDQSHNLKLEAELMQTEGTALQSIGHDLTEVPGCNELMGHAGAVVLDKQQRVSVATDPRSDGAALISESGNG